MKDGCVIDSNIIIYHLNGELDESCENLLADLLKKGSHISVISRIEIMGWQGHTEDSRKSAEDLLQRITEHPLNNEIAEICISICKNHRIKIPDAIYLCYCFIS